MESNPQVCATGLRLNINNIIPEDWSVLCFGQCYHIKMCFSSLVVYENIKNSLVWLCVNKFTKVEAN
jgi:hypothetical protein